MEAPRIYSTIKHVIVLYERGCAPCLRAFAVPPFLPSPRIVPDWSSPSRVRALPLRALDGSGPIQRTQFMREKRGSGRVDGPEGNLSVHTNYLSRSGREQSHPQGL